MMEYYFDTWRLVSDVSWFSTLLLCSFTVLLVYLNIKRDPKYPPGPRLYPIIGNLPVLLGKDIQGTIGQLRKQYGDVFGLYIGTELTVFVNGHDAIHNALVKQGTLFSQRPVSNFHKLIMKYPGILFRNGTAWKEQRSFALNSIRDICFKNGGSCVEEIIYQEIDSLRTVLQESIGPVYMDDYIYTSVGNVICMVLYRHRFEFKDELFESVQNYFRDATKDFSQMTVLSNCFPYLYYLPGDILGIRKIIRNHEKVRNVFMPHVSKSSTSGPCVHQAYLEAIDSNQSREDSSFTPKQMKSSLFDLLGAGMDTTSATIHWVVLHLTRNPNVQEKMFEEIKSVVGVENKPEIKDKVKLPYTDAVILEVMRISAVTPLGVPHTVSRDTTFSGHFLPENCTIMINLESCLKDPDVWTNPEEFRPERFLNHDGTKVEIPDEFIPFAAGPRSCLGETLAKLEIFLIVTSLIQYFKFRPEVDNVLPTVEGQLGLVWRPLRFGVRITRR